MMIGTALRDFTSRCVSRWKQYRYRFAPWILLTWKERSVRYVEESTSAEVEEDILLSQLEKIFLGLDSSSGCGLSDRQLHQTADWSVNTLDGRSLGETQYDSPTRIGSRRSIVNNEQYTASDNMSEVENTNNEHVSADTLGWSEKMKVFYEEVGFMVERKRSKVDGGGLGVFVTSGTIPKGCITAIYPGVVYRFGDPILLQSINNPFIFSCSNGWLIDGRDRGLSSFIYRSCSGRDRLGPYDSSDTSWIEAAPSQSSSLNTELSSTSSSSLLNNPLSIGQYVNNHTNECGANVMYQEVDIPLSFPLPLRKYIPNIFYSGLSADEHPVGVEPDYTARWIRTVLLVSLRPIEQGEELYSNYVTITS